MSSLTALPVEVLDAVVENLCLHCTPPKKTDRLDGSIHRQRICRVTALASLCLTSRALNQVATRHLYHRPDCAKWWLLAQTLITRKELRPHVKHLDSLGWKYIYSQEDPDEVPGYNNKKAWLLERADNIAQDARATLLSGDGDTDGSMEIMCSLCPNVERLEVNDGSFEKYFFRPPGSMTEVKHLEVSADDPEYGFNVADLEVLFLAAPNLETLVFHEAGHCGELPLTLSHVTRLDLNWCDLNAEAFANVLRLCPNLENLRYVSKGFGCESSEPFTPRDAKEIIERSTDLKSLRSFHLDMSQCEAELCWMEEEVDVEEELQDAEEVLTARGINFTFKA
ncbi:hypothetical protein NKR19_g5027 [Coniochaeta hoffmannii]|uniref:F-box domain-containing protein n=1 Tax=Coniochaeta hoffmannii TaxID=91930 RepID=A0AA38RZR8_9PEZI|nr:hypothetical protein NKR19_g5027 [Coniochaeta hoffmannii]